MFIDVVGDADPVLQSDPPDAFDEVADDGLVHAAQPLEDDDVAVFRCIGTSALDATSAAGFRLLVSPCVNRPAPAVHTRRRESP
jgi:hypothetical protein